jgi:predicted nucleic acid-binding Zn ribbon protein
MADIRTCEQCGTAFSPRREHARFCSARCRVAWNRENTRNPAAETSALQWSITAMNDTIQRLPRVRAWDRPRAFAVIGEAVWWVNIVDATLVRYHPEAYDRVLDGRPSAERALIEETLAGLRFVRNRMGQDSDHIDFIRPPDGRPRRSRVAAPGDGPVTAWTWNPMPEPVCASLSSDGQAWEMTRYRAYQARLAGRTVGEIFGRSAAFLKLAAARAAPVPGGRLPATG